jgi:hypothetical protein
MEDAEIYIDYANTGKDLVTRSVKYLESIIVTDPDKDMSGASIWAVKKGQARDGAPVDIALAWGQNPATSDPSQELSLDMGTTVPPFTLISAAKTVDKAIVNPGEEMTYTIRYVSVFCCGGAYALNEG